MIINYAIVSTDDSFYKEYWEVVKKAWIKLGIKPVCIHVGEDEGFEDDVIYLKLVDGIKPSFQAQIARIWAYKHLEGNAIISDMDMMPLSSTYFNGIAKQFNEDTIVSYCSDAKERFDGTEPMCYILANCKIMNGLLEHETWEDFVRWMVYQTGEGWSGDQWYITQLLNKYENVVRLSRGWNEAGCANNRLDRLDWRFNDADVKEGRIYDAHLLRPYEPNTVEINRLLNLIP